MRLFTAITLPSEIRDSILNIPSPGIKGIKWLKKEQLHLTLFFLGEVNEHTYKKVKQTLTGIKFSPFTLRVKGVDIFASKRKLRIIWAGIDNPEPVIDIQEEISSRLLDLGFEQEHKRFTPHITIGRAKMRVKPETAGNFLAMNSLFQTDQFKVDSFELMSSRLKPEGAEYSIEKSIPAAEEL